jgi:hypothetical protein
MFGGHADVGVVLQDFPAERNCVDSERGYPLMTSCSVGWTPTPRRRIDLVDQFLRQLTFEFPETKDPSLEAREQNVSA